jgi:twinkle protein
MEQSGVTKGPCPKCGPEGDGHGDNLVNFGPGRGAHCFACGHHVHGDGHTIETATSEKLTNPLRGKIMPLNHRRIDERTTRLYDYRLAVVKRRDGSKPIVEVENYFVDGEVVAQHVRGKGKEFRWRGDTSSLPLWGQWLFSGSGKRIVVTEGSIDCMTISMMWQNKWPVVSLPNGVNHAPKAIRQNTEFLSGYDEIVLCFDNDEAGRTAAQKCAELLPAGKVRIAHTPLKDANEHLLRNDTKALMSAIYEARQYQPDGILHASDVADGDAPSQSLWTFPWDSLTTRLMGQRSGEMTMWASGTGSGKSTVMRELAYHHLIRGRRVGLVMLEEAPMETLDDMIALRLSKPVRQIRAARMLNATIRAEDPTREALDFGYTDDLTDEEYKEARTFFGQLPLYIYDHHGTNEFTNILQRVEYLASALECDVIIIDHVTALLAGMARNGSERECLDEIMKKLRSIVERTGVHLDVVSQLNRLDGKAAEEGGQISLKNLRGSGSLGSVPNSVIAIERNQQAEDPEERRIVKVRSLKGRFTGETGVAGHLRFNPDTRRLEEAEWAEPSAGESNARPEPEFPVEDLDAEVILPEAERSDSDAPSVPDQHASSSRG